MITPSGAPLYVSKNKKLRKNDKWLLVLFLGIFIAAITSVVVVVAVLQWLFSL